MASASSSTSFAVTNPFEELIGQLNNELKSIDVEVLKRELYGRIPQMKYGHFTAIQNARSGPELISILRGCRFLSALNLGLLKDLLKALKSEVLLSKVEEFEKSEQMNRKSSFEIKEVKDKTKLTLNELQLDILVFHGNVIIDRGSRFQAHFAKVTSEVQMQKVLDHIEKDPNYADATKISRTCNLYDPEKNSIFVDYSGGFLEGRRLGKLLELFNVNDIVVITIFWEGQEFLYRDIYKNTDECVLRLFMAHGLIPPKSPEDLALFLERFEDNFEMFMKSAIQVKLIKPETQSKDFDFIHSKVIEDHRSKFQAHLTCITSQEQVEQALEQLKRDSKIAKAYSIVVCRIFDNEKKEFVLSCDDYENEACKRLLHLLQICKVEDVVVIVSHWHGGDNTGPDRFKHINACTLEVIKIATEAGIIHTSAPIEIICRGPQALEAYKNALLNGKTKNQRLFLMLIGPSRSGKTSLLKSFKGEDFDLDEDSTDLIALHRYFCKLVPSVWVKDSSSEEKISFESVMAKRIAENYQVFENSDYGVEREEKRSMSADGISSIEDKVDAKSHPVVDIDKKRSGNANDISGSGNPEKSFVEPEIVRQENSHFSRNEAVDSQIGPGLQEKILDALAKQEDTESEDIICTALDIAGQPVYNVTHPLFISTKGIFVLVHNLENDANSQSVPLTKKGHARRKVVDKCHMTNMDHLDFWLSFVALNATRQTHDTSSKCTLMPQKLPPVFLACTHADRPFDGQDAKGMSREILEHLKIKDHLPGEHVVKRLYLVDNTVSGSSDEDEGVRRLRKDICEVAKCLPYMNEDIPVRWFRFEKKLASLVQVGKKRYLSTDEAKTIALDCKVDVKSDEFFTLLNYLHDIREIIFFEGTETVFIDIPWLINMISSVITVEPFENWQEEQRDSWTKLENEGVLDVSLLEHVWREIADDKHAIDSLLVIMEKFSLVCRWKIDDKEDVFLVPAMLMNSSAKDIAELLKDQMPPLIVYFPSSHLPLGIFPRLQVLFAELCNRKWSSARPPKFFHNFCRFFSIGKDESFDLVLTSDIRTISIGVISNNEADDQKISDVCQEIIEFLKTKLGTDMRKDFPWMERMKYNLCIRCPICKPSPDCNLPHVPGCVSPACVHFITEEEILKEKRLRCLENPTSKVTDIPCDYFSHWFPKPEKASAFRPIHGAGAETVPFGITSTTGSLSLDENNSRWVVVGIAIMKVLLPALRSFVLPNITKHYNDLKTSHNIHTQVFGTHLKIDGTYKFNYDSINSNQGKKPPLFDYMVTSEVDLAKLYLKPFMAKFTGIDESCDLSAVLGILSSASVFTMATQDAAKDVRQHVRNEWGHCNFTVWDEAKIADCFKLMDVLVKSLILADEEEKKLLEQLKEWEEKGVEHLLGNPADGGLLKLHEDVTSVLKEVQSLKESNPEEFQRINSALQAIKEEVVKRLKKLEEGQEEMKTMLRQLLQVHGFE